MGAFFFTVHLRGNDVERTAALAADALAPGGERYAVATALAAETTARAAVGRAATSPTGDGRDDGGWLTLVPAFAYDGTPALARLGTALGAPLLSTVTADSDAWFATVYADGAVLAACESNTDDAGARERLREAVARCFAVELDDAWLRGLLLGRRIDEERRMDDFARALGIGSAANELDALRAGRITGIVSSTLRYVVAPGPG